MYLSFLVIIKKVVITMAEVPIQAAVLVPTAVPVPEIVVRAVLYIRPASIVAAEVDVPVVKVEAISSIPMLDMMTHARVVMVLANVAFAVEQEGCKTEYTELHTGTLMCI